jgi:hypothetical protein
MKWLGFGQDSVDNSQQSANGTPGYMRIKADPEEEIPQRPRPASRPWWMPPGWQREEQVIQVASAADPEISPELPEELQASETRWRELADRGELCIYTCLSFKNGGRTDDLSVDWHLNATLVALIALQVLVPALMLVHQLKRAAGDYPKLELEFRIVGFILYLYSIRSMYNNCVGECRAIFLEMAFQYNLPFAYVWPLVLGELINSFAAFTLCVTLFTVFCEANHLQDLVINCIAINFIGNVDSEFCTQELKEFAVAKFHSVARDNYARENDPETCCRSYLEKSLAFLLWLLRTIGTAGFGTCLACIFLLSHEAMICERIELSMLC